MMQSSQRATEVYEAIHRAIQSNDKMREPMNALIVWTELGKGLSGTLDKKGAEPGLLQRIIVQYCKPHEVEAVDLTQVLYRVEESLRLSRTEMAAALSRVEREIEPVLLSDSGNATSDEQVKELFLTTVRGWFHVGVDIMRSMPTHTNESEANLLRALGAWCAKYFPQDNSSPKDLGVRMIRE